VALVAAVAAAGCGFGEGPTTEGTARLTVTRDYGVEPMLEASFSEPPESETVVRFLDREAEITTRYGGAFVQSIDGVSGEIAAGRTRDWFFFVNGIESSVGAAEVTVRGGDRIWWDYRDWTDALRTPAVVGSWPEPFAQAAAGGEGRPVRVECAAERAMCELAAERLAGEGVDATVVSLDEAPADERPRLLVGDWRRLRGDPLVAQLARGPATSGVFARFRTGAGGSELVALDERAGEVDHLGPGAGLVAGLRDGEDPPAWVVTGTDVDGVEAAVEALDEETLANHYAVAVTAGAELPLPARSEDPR
jgi:hypothetical protein